MRFEDLEYLAWAHAHMGSVRHDLAASGARPLPAEALGPVRLDDPAATGRLRDRLAAWLGVAPGEVLPTLGTSQALWLACVARVGPGEVALVEEPRYEPLGKVPAAVGARVLPFRRRPEESHALDVDRLRERLAETGARMVLLSSPHNPSGRADPDDAIARAAEACAEVGATLVVDEVYRPFLPTRRPRTLRALGGPLWTVGSLTKRYGLGWARIGWLAGPAAEVPDAWAGIRHSVGQNGTTYAGLGLAALDRLEALGEQALPTPWIDEGRALVARWAAGHPGVEWSAPEAGPFGWVRVPGAGDLRPRIEALAAEAGVLVSPGAFFGEPEAFRVAWTSPPATVAEGLARLDRLVAG